MREGSASGGMRAAAASYRETKAGTAIKTNGDAVKSEVNMVDHTRVTIISNNIQTLLRNITQSVLLLFKHYAGGLEHLFGLHPPGGRRGQRPLGAISGERSPEL